MEPNIPGRFTPTVDQTCPGVLSDWAAGRIALHRGDDLMVWAETVEQAARNLGEPLDLLLDYKEGLGYARINKGFPLGVRPYSQEAKEWVKGQPVWAAQHSSWNRLFQGEPRGIC